MRNLWISKLVDGVPSTSKSGANSEIVTTIRYKHQGLSYRAATIAVTYRENKPPLIEVTGSPDCEWVIGKAVKPDKQTLDQQTPSKQLEFYDPKP